MPLQKINKPNQISTSIRFPEDVYKYVDSLSGRSFTSKLIGLIRDDMNGCSDRRNNLDEINLLIIHEKLLLQGTVDSLRDQLCTLHHQIDQMEITLGQLNQDEDDSIPPEDLWDPPEEIVPPDINDELPFN